MRTPVSYVSSVHHPEAFHGTRVRGGFFEGWYVKLVSADRTRRWAVIPGVFRSTGTHDHVNEAFVQVLDGLTGRSWYHAFPRGDFHASTHQFAVRVGENTFDGGGITLDLPELSGRVDFTTPMDPYPVSPLRPGIMGWYGYVPIMECFHGVVSFGHELAGDLRTEQESASFDGGRGYIEKDWGRSFPAAYVWGASNHLIDRDGSEEDGSLMASCAIIPGLGRTFRGFIVALRRGRTLSTWATWNGSRDMELTITDTHVTWRMRGPQGTLSLRAERVRGGLLHAPLRTAMHKRVEETLDAVIEIHHVSPVGVTLFEGVGVCAGLEVFGDTDRLMRL
ncbi:tocopherol cyclase family protein [Microbacterium gorillae]|uniref:tocopherol cyclase family protein n=1 Tax=Microbacterium gorillae TaxID=1231063 RepID=UPI0005902EB2|nr:tocopherol cyclase family protein [Microbacterium gorillae]